MQSLPSPERIRDLSIKRHRIIQDLHQFFLDRDYLPVETPLLSSSLIPESSIEFFATKQVFPSGKSRELYLVPSPEIWMKLLLAAGSGPLFQINRSFRNSEQSGKRHNPEFTMLEWYGTGIDYRDNITLTGELLRYLSQREYCCNTPIFSRDIEVVTLEEAFLRWAGFSLEKHISQPELIRKALELGLPVEKSDSQESIFNLILVSMIEPSLPTDRPCILKDYPAFVRTLSKRISGTPWCERWELYIGQDELANCFTEETGIDALQDYYRAETTEPKRVPHKVDREFCRIFHEGMESLSGVALGVDRLIMRLLGIEDIQGVLLFPLL